MTASHLAHIAAGMCSVLDTCNCNRVPPNGGRTGLRFGRRLRVVRHLASGGGLSSTTTLSLGLGRGFFLSAPRRRVTMTDQERRHLAQADRHIAECKALIARQEELVRRIAQRGQPTDWAQNTLRAFESNLRAFEAQRNEIVAQIDAEQ